MVTSSSNSVYHSTVEIDACAKELVLHAPVEHEYWVIFEGASHTQRLLTPGKTVTSESIKLVGPPLQIFNLAQTNNMKDLKLSLNYLNESISKIDKVFISPVETTELAKYRQFINLGELLGTVSWPKILNHGDLIQCSCSIELGKQMNIWFKVQLLLDSEHKRLPFGLYDSKFTLVEDASGSLLLSSVTLNVFNEDKVDEIQQFLESCLRSQDKISTLLMKGLAGMGKRTALLNACKRVGLVLHDPYGVTKRKFTENVRMFAEYAPCCIKVDSNDFEMAYNVLRNFCLDAPIIIVAISDNLDEYVQGVIRNVISFPRLSTTIRKRILDNVLPEQFVNLATSLTDGFSIMELEHLGRLFSIQPEQNNPALESCLRHIRTKRLGLFSSDIPKVSWDQVAGLDEAKAIIKQSLTMDSNNPFGKRQGILLYGPPGTGKTLLAKAIATEYQMSFISVKGPELMSMYIGETESNIRELFAQARTSQPTILFFDELDSLAVHRGQDADSGGITDRIVAQLMVEIDKVSEDAECHVFIIGATNRPDLIDVALLRPGRIDKMVYLGPPKSKNEQIAILQASSKCMNLDESVNFESLTDIIPLSLSPADLANVCQSAMRHALCEKIRAIEAKTTDSNPSSDSHSDSDLIVTIRQSDFIHSINQILS